MDTAEETDPNADLIGFEFESDHGRMRVVRTCEIPAGYVECEGVETSFKTCRVASQLRTVMHAKRHIGGEAREGNRVR